jgi:hypothetical protein
MRLAIRFPLTLALALGAGAAQALPEIPAEPGWAGFINLGAGVASSESNLLAGVLSQDLGSDRIDSLDDTPGSEDLALPLAQFEATYTLADSGTQFFATNRQSDFLSFDFVSTMYARGGIRQAIDSVGTFELALGGNTFPVDVWKDPYQLTAPRGDTERTSTGLSVGWDRIFGSGFEFRYEGRKIELDDERSGESLPLDAAAQRALRREGNINRADLQYRWGIAEGHVLVSGLAYVDHDLDGDAMARDGLGLSLRHEYQSGRWRVVSGVAYAELESDDANPIYAEEAEFDSISLSLAVFYARPFGWDNWTANLSASYYDEDSNIDFYDNTFGMLGVGMLYRF